MLERQFQNQPGPTKVSAHYPDKMSQKSSLRQTTSIYATQAARSSENQAASVNLGHQETGGQTSTRRDGSSYSTKTSPGSQFFPIQRNPHQESEDSALARSVAFEDAHDLKPNQVSFEAVLDDNSGLPRIARSSREEVHPPKSFAETKARWELLRMLVGTQSRPEESAQIGYTQSSQSISPPTVQQEITPPISDRRKSPLSIRRQQSQHKPGNSGGIRPLMLVEGLESKSASKSSNPLSSMTSSAHTELQQEQSQATRTELQPVHLDRSRLNQRRLPSTPHASSTSQYCSYCHASMTSTGKNPPSAFPSTRDDPTSPGGQKRFNQTTSPNQGKITSLNPQSEQMRLPKKPSQSSAGSRRNISYLSQTVDRQSLLQPSEPSSDTRINPLQFGYPTYQTGAQSPGSLAQQISTPETPYEAFLPPSPNRRTVSSSKAPPQQDLVSQDSYHSSPSMLQPQSQTPSKSANYKPYKPSDQLDYASSSMNPTTCVSPDQGRPMQQPTFRPAPTQAPNNASPSSHIGTSSSRPPSDLQLGHKQIGSAVQSAQQTLPKQFPETRHPISRGLPLLINRSSVISQPPPYEAKPSQQRNRDPVQAPGQEYPAVGVLATLAPSRPSGSTANSRNAAHPAYDKSATPDPSPQNASRLGGARPMAADEHCHRLQNRQGPNPAYQGDKAISGPSGIPDNAPDISSSALRRVGAQRRPLRMEAEGAVLAAQNEGSLDSHVEDQGLVQKFLD